MCYGNNVLKIRSRLYLLSLVRIAVSVGLCGLGHRVKGLLGAKKILININSKLLSSFLSVI